MTGIGRTRPDGGASGREPGVLRDQRGFGLVEILIASTIAVIGLVSVAGLQLAVAAQSRMAAWQTGQALAAQEVFERMNEAGYAAAASGSDSVTIDGHTFRVNLSVTSPIVRVKQVTASVAAVGSIGPQIFVTRIHDRRSVPAAP